MAGQTPSYGFGQDLQGAGYPGANTAGNSAAMNQQLGIGGPANPQMGLYGMGYGGGFNMDGTGSGQQNNPYMGGMFNYGGTGAPGYDPSNPGGGGGMGGYGGQPMPYQPIVGGSVPQNNEPQVPGGPASGPTPFGQSIEGTAANLLNTGGGVDQGIITSQTDQARGMLDQQRTAQLQQDQSELAQQGLMGSGAEGNALGILDKNMSQAYGSDLSGILSNEYNNANQRMMGALNTGAGMAQADQASAQNAYNAQTGRAGTLGELGLQGQAIGSQNQLGNRGLDIQDELGSGSLTLQQELGEGQLGLGEQSLNEDYAKSLNQLGFNQDQLAYLEQQGNIGDLSGILAQMGILGGQANNGYY